MGPLALVGFAESRAEVFKVDYPVWTINNADFYQIPRVERLIDLHSRQVLINDGRWDWLKEAQRDYPVYLLEEWPEIPNSYVFPLQRVLDECFANLYVGAKHVQDMSCSFSYLLSFAVIDSDYDPIYCYGVEAGSDTEWRYQREGIKLICGWAVGKGRTVIFPEGSPMFPPTLYGYEDYQFITRDQLEQMALEIEPFFERRRNKVNGRTLSYEDPDLRFGYMADGAIQFLTQIANDRVSRQTLELALRNLAEDNSVHLGRFNSLHNIHVLKLDAESADGRLEAFANFFLTAGAMQVCDHLIKVCDRRAGRFEFKDPLVRADAVYR